MNELELLNQKRMQELMARQAQQQQQDAELEQQVQQLESVVKTLFTKEALQRYGNLKAAHPETAIKVLAFVGQAIQAGKIQKIDDEKLKGLLQKIAPAKKDIKITRK